MKNRLAGGPALPPGVIVVVLIVLLGLVGFLGWKWSQASSPANAKVQLNVDQIKKDLESGSGFGDR